MKCTDRPFGVELEFDFCNRGVSAVQRLLEEHNLDHWTDGIHYDGSEIEISSPILTGRNGFKELKLVMTMLSENGARCYGADGMHVHHSAPELVLDKSAAERLLDTWNNNREHITKFVDPMRRRYGACPPWGVASIQDFKEHDSTRDDYFIPSWTREWVERKVASGAVSRRLANSMVRCWQGGRMDLNLSALAEHGTVEFRLHEGTMDFSVAEPWIKFGQYLISSVLKRKRPIPPVESEEALLTRVRVAKVARERLLAKAASESHFATTEVCWDCGYSYPCPCVEDDYACEGCGEYHCECW